jgi:uncharacterized protein (DUF1697 family)
VLAGLGRHLRHPLMSKSIALLRGINVGGKHKLPMTDLRRIFADAGAEDVRTYIQSGNVVFTASAAVARTLADRVADAVAEEFGFRPTVVTRTAAVLRKIAAANPFEVDDPKRVHVGFLRAKPKPTAIKRLDPGRSPGDLFVVKGTEIYLHYPNGMGRSKLTGAYLESTLGVEATMRNWRTVTELLAMV